MLMAEFGPLQCDSSIERRAGPDSRTLKLSARAAGQWVQARRDSSGVVTLGALNDTIHSPLSTTDSTATVALVSGLTRSGRSA